MDGTPEMIVENPLISQQDLADAVRSTALLADLTISMWGAERTDRKLMEEVKTQHNAVGNVGRTIKNLLAGCDTQLKATRAAYAAARTAHYQLTLPWVSNPHAERQAGPRLLPTMLFEKYLTEMSRLKKLALAELDKFVTEYPTLAAQAQVNLAGMAVASDYPTPEYVRAAFNLAFDFEPIAPASAFSGLPEHFVERLGAGLRRKQESAAQQAQAAMWERVKQTLEPLIERLSKPDAMFKTSTLEHVRDLIVLLPGFNVTGDPRITTVVDDIRSMLSGVSATTVREDATRRADVVNRARAVTDKLNQWGL
jgi:hypothetical protein